MSLFRLSWPFGGPAKAAEPDPARRRLLLGFGAVACAAAVAASPFGSEAEAAEGAGEDLLDRIDGEDGSYEVAQYHGHRHHRSSRRHHRRQHRRYYRGRRRYYRRSARYDCRYRWFRRQNPRLCGVYRRRRRYGGCVRIGNVTVCD
ncbi:hypothetical protein E3C22_11460 [Jiella endophytica]|uniref:Protamine-2 (Modular protein) n=1 Tax=Jiella endophytica TaxID=2558362 RepID=A0A4Y8RLQ5_9HYPH|nr:hypothetical protein [Jiella endophytica]TFF23053.1 hypothetical protein E3C22_11460 [Jiella endophytica]